VNEQERRRTQVRGLWQGHDRWELSTHGGVPIAYERRHDHLGHWLVRDRNGLLECRDAGPAELGDLTEHELSEHTCGLRGPDGRLLCPLIMARTG
jgi:hypothetical protein